MYFTKVRVIGVSGTAEKIREGLESLGYYITERGENLRVVVGPISKAVKYVNSKPVISVSEDGEYIIPLTGIESGVSFVASVISDIIGGSLILTSKTSEKGLYSVQEFSWINGLYWLRRDGIKEVNRKLVERGSLLVYSSGFDNFILPEGYERADFPCDADIVIGENSCKGLTLMPYKVIVGLKFIQPIPVEVILYSIKLTLKSLYLNERRVDVIVTGVRNSTIGSLGKIMGSEVSVIEGDTCESLLLNYGGKTVLRGVKRAYGLETCLGVLRL
ncbi:hypothetical protein [Stygiolobus caldivivus]|uniref:Uncharacterized protein n=1 Tax=Stygiolobus caldivivus TaxID=2824673 RepID=A0A8D5ZIC9_9CREN|nr:hypothetical protein [Stygiolobus caldivivus]BCU69315.1 hypothetical protein KN1_06120 [Stygiolobus caldivivus]